VEHATEHAGFQADQSEIGGYGASDQTSFTARQVPTLFFFSGLHSDYHKPSDTWDKIDAKDAVRVLAEVSEISTALADAIERPQFLRVAESSHMGDHAASGGGGYGPYFGSIPDFGIAWRALFRRTRGIAGCQGGLKGRRCSHRIRWQAHRQSNTTSPTLSVSTNPEIRSKSK
jgi:hypothetical protein